MDNNKDKDFGLPKTKFEPVNMNNTNSSTSKKNGVSTKILIYLGLFLLVVGGIVGGIFILKNKEEDDDDEIETKDSTSIFEDSEEPKESKEPKKEQQEEETPKTNIEDEEVRKREAEETTTDDNEKSSKNIHESDTTTEEGEHDTVAEEGKINQNKPIETDVPNTKNIDIKKSEIQKIYKPQNKYYIIWGAFLDEKNAYTRANKLKQGLQIAILYPNSTSIKYKVSIAEANNIEDANKIKSRLKQEYPGIWVFKY